MKRSNEYLEMKSKVIIYEDAICEGHLAVEDVRGRSKYMLPERPDRVRVISEALHAAPFVDDLIFTSPTAATVDELKSIHNEYHMQTVENAVFAARDSGDPRMVNNDTDVIVTRGSQDAALVAAGAVRDAVHQVLGPSYIKRAFCNVRPPGHHAHCHKAEGFCLYNNIWFGAQMARKYLRNTRADPRIAIIDWDLHHGDGTQDFVMASSDYTYFVSIHQNYMTQFPQTGRECRKEIGNSIVICHNIPVNGGDEEVKKYFDTELIDDLTAWKPDIILVSCGFDAHTLDDIGRLNYSSRLYGWMTAELVKIADKCCGGRLVSVLEGGYNLRALREASVEHVGAML